MELVGGGGGALHSFRELEQSVRRGSVRPPGFLLSLFRSKLKSLGLWLKDMTILRERKTIGRLV